MTTLDTQGALSDPSDVGSILERSAVRIVIVGVIDAVGVFVLTERRKSR